MKEDKMKDITNTNVKSCHYCVRKECKIYKAISLHMEMLNYDVNVFSDVAKNCPEYIGLEIVCPSCVNYNDCALVSALQSERINNKMLKSIAKYCTDFIM